MPDETHPAPPETFYLTTPIYYVNARPHIGHAYSTIVADVLARRHRLLGHDTFFLTGTDEHGQKIERSAAAAGIPPQQFADQVSKTFSDLWLRMGITNDAFIRTTDPRHKQGVQKLFRQLYEQGHIYLSTYTGQYSIGEEMFVEGPPGTIGPDGRPTETVTEENFFFRLSAFQRPLLDLIESDTLKITPESSRNEVLSFLRGNVPNANELKHHKASLSTGEQIALLQRSDHPNSPIAWSQADEPYIPGALKDLSVSRSSFTWGIPVPDSVQQAAGATQHHVIYVWLDALANYMTAIGYGSDAEADQAHFKRYWPANLHLVGKEITRFHCVYWPAFLLALNPATTLPGAPSLAQAKGGDANVSEADWIERWLPKAVTANGWLLFDNSKMSKSKGNVVRTETILEAFGPLCPPVHLASGNTGDASLKGTASAVPPLAAADPALAAEVRPPTKAEQDLFATDVLRYFLLREIPFGQDGTFSFDSMVTRYNADLANGYGNLVSRTLSMISKYLNSLIEAAHTQYFIHSLIFDAKSDNTTDSDGFRDFLVALASLDGYAPETNPSRFGAELRNVWRLIGQTDSHVTSQAPWKIYANEEPGSKAELHRVLYEAAESIRICAAVLYSYCPTITAKVWSQLGLGNIEQAAKNGDLKNLQWGGLKPGTKLGPLSPIFPRADKSLPQIMADMELANQNPTKEKQMPTEDTSQQPADPNTHPVAPLKGASTPAPAAHIAEDPTDPAAPPRTSTLTADNPGAHVAASDAITTERPGTPPHTEAQASGIFAGTPDTPQIAIDDFTKIDLRVAKILVAERIPKADKLLRLEVDLGYEQRQILSGIAEHYTPEDLIGRKIVIIANLAPRKMRGLESRGMLLAASEGENGKPILATFGEDIAVGTRLR